MEIEVKERLILEDGLHKGVIIGVEYRTEPFEYIDFVLESEKCKIKAGFSQFLSKESKLGQLFKRFGVELQTGLKIEPEMLIGRECQFLTMRKETGKGIFANVAIDSLKPITQKEGEIQ